MKVVLADNQEVTITSANRSYNFNEEKYSMTLDVDSSVAIDEAVELFTQKNCEDMTIKRDGKEDIIIKDEGWNLSNILETVFEQENHVSVIFEKAK